MSSSRIYVASLSDYNNGDLHGEWFNVADYAYGDALAEDVAAMIAKGPAARRGEVAEEWAIHDYDGFDGIRISEWEDFDNVIALGTAIENLRDEGLNEAFGDFLEDIAGDIGYFADIDDAVERFREAYIGEMTLEDYAYSYAEDAIGLTGFALQYFDAEKFARDLSASGDVTETMHGHLFHGNW